MSEVLKVNTTLTTLYLWSEQKMKGKEKRRYQSDRHKRNRHKRIIRRYWVYVAVFFRRIAKYFERLRNFSASKINRGRKSNFTRCRNYI